jgi:hypothetical protein
MSPVSWHRREQHRSTEEGSNRPQSFPALGSNQMTSDSRPHSLEQEQHLIAQLADGSLDDRRRVAMEAYVASSPDAQQMLTRQRRVATALRAGGPVLTDQARTELDALAAQAQRTRQRLPVISLRPMLAVVAVAAAIVVAVVLLAGGHGTSPPSITKAALLAYRLPTESAPQPSPTDPKLLGVSFAGITLPNYERQFGVRATGKRLDKIGGRSLLTVYYRLPSGTPMSYSIVSGKPLALPGRTRLVTYRGVRIRGYTDRGLGIVTLVRHGRTCVLAGRTPVDTLVALAEAPLRPA